MEIIEGPVSKKDNDWDLKSIPPGGIQKGNP